MSEIARPHAVACPITRAAYRKEIFQIYRCLRFKRRLNHPAFSGGARRFGSINLLDLFIPVLDDRLAKEEGGRQIERETPGERTESEIGRKWKKAR